MSPFFPHHEPSTWLRRTAEAAALRIAAEDFPPGPGVNLIVRLSPVWPPHQPSTPDNYCDRCGATAEQRCGFQAASSILPGVRLKFCFWLCDRCAIKEYGASATQPLPLDIDQEADQ